MTARASATEGHRQWRPISLGATDRKHFPALAFHLGTASLHRVSMCGETTKYRYRGQHRDGPGSVSLVEKWFNGRRLNRPMSEVSGLTRAFQCRSNVAQKITIGTPYSLLIGTVTSLDPCVLGGNA
jgi:hypothetical protein